MLNFKFKYWERRILCRRLVAAPAAPASLTSWRGDRRGELEDTSGSKGKQVNIPAPLVKRALLCVVSILAAALYIKKIFLKKVIEGVPEVSALKFRHCLNDVHKHIADLAYEGHHKMVVMSTPFFSFAFATHPDTAREILKNETMDKKLGNPSLFTDMIEESLVASNKEDWRNQRTIMSPAFHFDFLKQLMPLMTTKTEELLTKLPKGEVFDAKRWLSKFTIDVLGLAAFGVDFNAMGETENEYYSAYQELFNHGMSAFKSVLPPRFKEMLPLPSMKRVHDAKAKLISMTHDIMSNRKKDSEKKYLLDMMLDAKPALTMKQFETNIFLFFLAGHETTASALSWALYLLAEHQDIQNRAREEVDRVLQGKHVTSDVLKELVYMDMFLKEVLRYGSPVGFISSRVADEDILVGEHVIPKGTETGVSVYAIHHNPDFWPEPYVFNPERFVSEAKQYPFSFLPFSLGKRVCIGNHFSLMEQKIFLCMVLQRYIITAPTNKVPFALDPNASVVVPRDVDIIFSKRQL
jgi:cytochrome P450